MDALWLILALVIGLAVGALVGWLIGSRKTSPGGDATLLAAAQAAAAAAQATAEERARAIDEANARNRQLLEQQERDAKIVAELTPIKAVLDQMTRKVNDMENQQKEQHGLISQQLVDSRKAGDELRATTDALSQALRSNNYKGKWGEAQLRRIVEVSGLLNYVDFYTQESASTDAGGIRPDMIIRLPGGRTIIIDAKVPFTAYLEASQIPVNATGDELAKRERLMGEHVRALRKHVEDLTRKSYWEGFENTSEFVVAFVPSESLLSAALELDPALLEDAFSKKVALASPVNLFAVLKTVAFAWNQEMATEKVAEIIKLGQELYKRIGVVAGHADDLRKHLDKTVSSYNAFAKSLERNLLTTAAEFPKLDMADTIAEVPAISSSTEGFRKKELTTGDE
jgi:DNA recombination protein RmuC